MRSKLSRLKTAVIIGAACIYALSFFTGSDDNANLQSWFITGTSFYEEISDDCETVVVNDKDSEVEFSFGLFELFRKIFS